MNGDRRLRVSEVIKLVLGQRAGERVRAER